MIRHRPAGRGHAYLLEPDQRVPVIPVAGEPVELRATTRGEVAPPIVDLWVDGARSAHAMEPAPVSDGTAPRSSEGHLAAAANGRVAPGLRAWRCVLPPMGAGTRLRYRFRSGDRPGDPVRPTRVHRVTVAGWVTGAGRLAVDGPAQRIVDGSVEWLVADGVAHRVRFAMRLTPGSHVVGFGERFDTIDQAGRRLDAVVFEQYKAQGARTYLPVPFAIVVGPRGEPAWGFHVRTSARTWYDVGATDPARLTVEVALDPWADGPVEVAVALYGGTPRDVLRAFLDEIGAPVVPPDWILRPWLSGNEWNTDARIRREVQRSLDEGIPVGVVVIEAWADESTFVAFRDARYEVHPDGAPHRLADFTFPPDGAWPDPKGLVDWLHERDVRVLLWQIPLVKARQPAGSQARADQEALIARGFAVREADGRPYRNRGWWFPGAVLPDWTNPDARAWWLAKRRYLVDEVGVDGFKTDGGEHAWGDELRYSDGSRGVTANNRFANGFAAAYHELLRASGRDGVTFSRAGFTGAGATPAHWAGDEDSTWDAFRASVMAGITAGASGVFFWGWDLAGFSGEIPDAELYLRAAAMAAFCPIMQLHSEYNHHRTPSRDRTPWNIAERTGDPRALTIYRDLARLRDELVPYLAEEGRRAVAARVPLMRGLWFDWPDDPEVWAHPFQYLLGDRLLVAPVVEPGRTAWPVYLPEGTWVDAWTDEVIVGGRVVEREVPLDRIPVFRRGAEPDPRLDPIRAAGRGPGQVEG
jgi:alpha-glucosidase (family GH31 glycosyl hydrolase)